MDRQKDRHTCINSTSTITITAHVCDGKKEIIGIMEKAL